ncbi:hypothetical protein MYX07_06610, partial [Patescibacteria group bacterium AH-259-L07]|nr:hypothetical protein [Patescibacteria group bacterium AH-259-L07]
MLKKVKQYIQQLFFPINCIGCKKEQTLLCTSCIKTVPLFKSYTSHKLPSLDTILIAANYHHPLVNKAIKIAKYRPYAITLMPALSTLTIKYLYQFPKICAYISDNHFVLVPIPLSRHKYAHRGFNQAERLAHELLKEFKWPLHTKLLIKAKHTPSQTELSITSRKTNIKSA